MLGIREPDIYGKSTYSDLVNLINSTAAKLGCTVECFQSNHEGKIVDKIQSAYGKFDAIIINPAAYTHTSIAILDALKSVGIPAAEIHISDVTKRENFRQISYAGMACEVHYIGMGFDGYVEAIKYFMNK